MTNKIWEITDKGLNLVLEYQERKNEGGEYREKMTICGHEMTDQEYRFARSRSWHQVNCKRCLAKA